MTLLVTDYHGKKIILSVFVSVSLISCSHLSNCAQYVYGFRKLVDGILNSNITQNRKCKARKLGSHAGRGGRKCFHGNKTFVSLVWKPAGFQVFLYLFQPYSLRVPRDWHFSPICSFLNSVLPPSTCDRLGRSESASWKSPALPGKAKR